MDEKNKINSDYLKQLTQTIESIGSSLLSLVNFADDLIPEDLYNEGLKHCIIKTCDSLNHDKKWVIEYSFKGNFNRLPETLETQIFKIFNILLSFILEQAKPRKITLHCEQKAHQFLIEITDDGEGFDVSNINSTGIHHIARIKLLVEKMQGSFSLNRINKNLNKTIIKVTL